MSEYKNPNDWYAGHWQELKEYVGEWVAYSKDGVISHDYLRYANANEIISR